MGNISLAWLKMYVFTLNSTINNRKCMPICQLDSLHSAQAKHKVCAIAALLDFTIYGPPASFQFISNETMPHMTIGTDSHAKQSINVRQICFQHSSNAGKLAAVSAWARFNYDSTVWQPYDLTFTFGFFNPHQFVRFYFEHHQFSAHFLQHLFSAYN